MKDLVSSGHSAAGESEILDATTIFSFDKSELKKTKLLLNHHPKTLQTLQLTFLHLKLVVCLHRYKRINYPNYVKLQKHKNAYWCVSVEPDFVKALAHDYTLNINDLVDSYVSSVHFTDIRCQNVMSGLNSSLSFSTLVLKSKCTYTHAQ